MATIVNSPGESDSGAGFIFGLIALLLFIVVLFYFIVPMFRGGTSGGTQLQVPNKVDVNVQKPQ